MAARRFTRRTFLTTAVAAAGLGHGRELDAYASFQLVRGDSV